MANGLVINFNRLFDMAYLTPEQRFYKNDNKIKDSTKALKVRGLFNALQVGSFWIYDGYLLKITGKDDFYIYYVHYTPHGEIEDYFSPYFFFNNCRPAPQQRTKPTAICK